MENAMINKMTQLPDSILAMAFAVLFSDEWKKHFNDRSKAAEMISIINGNTQPCCPFINWMQCIAYLLEAAKATQQ